MSEDRGPGKKKPASDQTLRGSPGRAIARPASHHPRPPSNTSLHIRRQDQHGALNIEAHQGIFPSPRTMYEYQLVDPRIVTVIVDETQTETSHRRKREDYLDKVDATQGYIGQIFGLTVTLAFLIVSAIVILQGHEVVGTVMASVDLVALVGLFVAGPAIRRARDKDDTE